MESFELNSTISASTYTQAKGYFAVYDPWRLDTVRNASLWEYSTNNISAFIHSHFRVTKHTREIKILHAFISRFEVCSVA